MANSSNQLPSHTSGTWRKTRRKIKRQTRRTVRQLGKRLLEDAPKKVMRGYAD